MFTIIHLDTQSLLSDRILTEDGKKAARIARLLSIRTNSKYQVRKIEAGDLAWEERERSRFASGDYLPLHGSLARFVQNFWPSSYAHIAKRDPSCIAYTKDELKGRADLQSVASIATFCGLLTDKYMALYPDEDRSHTQETFNIAGKQHYAEAVVSTSPVLFASTPDEIANVYMNYAPGVAAVSGSCMRYGCPDDDETSQYNPAEVTVVDEHGVESFFHPASVYGAGDLAVAYMVDANGQTIARALCWPEKKLYSRVYASGDAFHRALQALGFTKSSGYFGGSGPSMIGARLLMVRSVSGYAIMPYVDELRWVTDRDGHFTLGGSISAQFTSGACRYSVPKVVTCPHCSSKFRDKRGTYVHTREGVQLWCEDCAAHDDVYSCRYNGAYYYRPDFPAIRIIEGSLVALVNAEAHYSVCEYYQQYTCQQLQTVVVDTDGRIMRVSPKAVRDLKCFFYAGKNYLPHLAVKVIMSINVMNCRARRALCELLVMTVIVPLPVIYHEDYPAYFAADGQWYHKRYKDYSPMPAPRIPAAGASARTRTIRLAHAPVLPSFAHRYIGA